MTTLDLSAIPIETVQLLRIAWAEGYEACQDNHHETASEPANPYFVGYCVCDSAIVQPSPDCGIPEHRYIARKALGRLADAVKELENDATETDLALTDKFVEGYELGLEVGKKASLIELRKVIDDRFAKLQEDS